MTVSGAGGTMAAKPEFDPDLIRAACADGDEGAIVEFCTTLSGNLVQRETLTVRRHINWNNHRPDLREDLAHLVQDIKRRICGIASAGFPAFSV